VSVTLEPGAKAFAESGASVALADWNEKAVRSATEELAAQSHGAIGLTKSAALEYASKGIRINAVCAGIIDTPMVAGMLATQAEAVKELMKDVPMGRLGRAEEIVDAVLWLCSPAASFVIGHALAVDGGFTVH
jgi:NAD(P)-dependent dehydrogenase (short-subunit alcohol dehydrogenase family)